MTTLVDDLLDVSRVTRGLVQLEQECVDIKLAVANAVEQARPLIEARRHVLTVLTGAAPAMVNGDRTRLVQVVANLLNNAAKYTPQGGAITLEVGVDAAMVHISVSDNGIGINAALLPHIFDLFTQAERTPDRGQGGLGIGLALVRTIVTLHGGIVTAHSDGPGLGSMFNIALPAAAQLATQSTAQLAAQSATQSGAAGYPGAPRDGDTPTLAAAAPASSRVMIVDDNIDAAALLAELLGAQGHQVSVLPHPFDALAAARLHPPRAFILDIGLPEIDGYELARRLRAEPGNGQALFIALTGYGQEHDRILSRHAGFDHHFVKPVDLARLSEVLARLDA
jgi:CheY-like chemotaxis protein